jgi:hypothetical protein
LLKQSYDKKSAEYDDINSKLQSKIQSFDELTARSNEQKSALLKGIQNLEEEKKRLEALNAACKGDINENTRALSDSLKRN